MKQKQPAKKIPRRIFSALLLLALVFSLAACNRGNQQGCRVVATVGTQSLAMAFRTGDPVGVLVPAALRELKSDGTVARISAKWFGSDLTTFTAEQNAVAAALQSLGLSAPPSRDFILGIDDGAVPFSFTQNGTTVGFDIDLAQAVCDKLGWNLKIQPISPMDAAVELASDDIDCAWGGLSFPGGSTGQMAVSAPYLTEDQVVVVMADSGVTRLSQLKGKLITMRDSVNLINIFENSASLNGLNLSKRYLPSIEACFEALNQGACDAVLVGSLAAKYIMAGNAG